LQANRFEPTLDSAFQISGSFGVAELEASHATLEDLVAEADRRLYEAKEAGRDKAFQHV
jgi:GGDEF domain-containing protein